MGLSRVYEQEVHVGIAQSSAILCACDCPMHCSACSAILQGAALDNEREASVCMMSGSFDQKGVHH